MAKDIFGGNINFTVTTDAKKANKELDHAARDRTSTITLDVDNKNELERQLAQTNRALGDVQAKLQRARKQVKNQDEDYIKYLEEQEIKHLDDQRTWMNKLRKLGSEKIKSDQDAIKANIKDSGLKDLEDMTQRLESIGNILNKQGNKNAQIIQRELNTYDEIESRVHSIGDEIGTNTAEYKNALKVLQDTKRVIESINFTQAELAKTTRKKTTTPIITGTDSTLVEQTTAAIEAQTSAVEELEAAFEKLEATYDYSLVDDAKDVESLNNLYKERLGIIKEIGAEKLKSFDSERYLDAEDFNKTILSRIDGWKQDADDDIYNRLDDQYSYDNQLYTSSAELESLLENRKQLLKDINFEEAEDYQEATKINQAIQDRIALMKELEPLIASGAMSYDAFEAVVYERGTLDERREQLGAVQQDLLNAEAENIDEAQMVLDQYEKILVTTASGKALELGPNMTEADYKSFMNMDAEKAKSIEFIRPAIEATTSALSEQGTEVAKLTSEYEGLAEAVEKLAVANTKVLHAYDNGLPFNDLVEQSNEIIASIANMFPADFSGMTASLSQSAIATMLGDRQFRELPAAELLIQIENQLTQARNEETAAIEKNTKAAEENAKTRQELINKAKEVYPTRYLVEEAMESNPNYLDDLYKMKEIFEDTLQPVKQLVSEITVLSKVTTNSTNDLEALAVETSKALSAMYDDVKYIGSSWYDDEAIDINKIKEYIALQYKFTKIIEKLNSRWGGVKGSGAKNAFELTQWTYSSIERSQGYRVDSNNVIDAIYGQGKYSIFGDDGKKIPMRSLAAELLGYQGTYFGGDFGAELDDSRLTNINKAIQEVNFLNKKKEIEENAKVIESYEELCAVVERYNALYLKSSIYGDMDRPSKGLHKDKYQFKGDEELELIDAVSRLRKSGMVGFFKYTAYICGGKIQQFGLDKLAKDLGLYGIDSINIEIDKANKALDELAPKIANWEEKIASATNESSQQYLQSILDGLNNQRERHLERIKTLEAERLELLKSQGAQEKENVQLSLLGEKSGKNFKNSITSKSKAAKATKKQAQIDNGSEQVSFYQVELASQRKQQELKLTQQAAIQTEQQAATEEHVAEAVERTQKAKKEELETTKKNAQEVAKSVDIIAKNAEQAIEILNNAKRFKTAIANFSNVTDVSELQDEVTRVSEQILGSNLTVGTTLITDSTVQIHLINKELGILVKQMWQLESAGEDVEGAINGAGQAMFKLVSTSAKQDPEKAQKYLEAQQKAIDDTAKWINSQQGKLNTLTRLYQVSDKPISGDTSLLQIDATSLKGEADKTIDDLANHIQERLQSASGQAISSGVKNSIEKDLTALTNEIKTQQSLQYAASTMSPTEVKSQREIFKNQLDALEAKARKKNIFDQMADSVETLRQRLNDVDIEGYVSDRASANKFTDDLRVLNSRYDALSKQAEQQAYYDSIRKNVYQNDYKYTMGKTSSDQSTLDQMSGYYKKQEEEAQNFNTNMKSIYKDLMSTMSQINNLDSQINKLALKDGGSGLYQKPIENLQSQKSALMSQFADINAQINQSLNVSPDENGLTKFFDVARERAVLTSTEIEKFDALLAQTNNIKFDFGEKVASKIQPTIENLSELQKMIASGSITNKDVISGVDAMSTNLNAKMQTFKESGNALDAIGAINYADNINANANALYKLAQAESQYFSNKRQYTNQDNIGQFGALSTEVKNAEQSVESIQSKLSKAAQEFAKDEAIITGFKQSADGISTLNFSVFDKGTSSLRQFSMEMGGLSDKMYLTENTVDKTAQSMKSATQQIDQISNLLKSIEFSGFNINPETASQGVAKLYTLMTELQSAMQSGDPKLINEVLQKSKLATSEVQKLYNESLKLKGAVESGNAKVIGSYVGDSTYTAYDQLTNAVSSYANSTQDAALKIGKFNEKQNTLDFTLTRGNGNVEHYTASISQLSKQMVAQSTGVTKLKTGWQDLTGIASKTVKSMFRMYSGYMMIMAAMRKVRKGISYIQDIDLAMTELRKVTDETEVAYSKFLKTAAQTGGKIGATTSDYVNAAAGFARLGYTMKESSDMAQSALVYKNVGDGLDSVDEATQSITSTMKAFGVESTDTMSIVDKFNEVGE